MSGIRRCVIMLVSLALLFAFPPPVVSAGEIVRIPLDLPLNDDGLMFLRLPVDLAFDAGRALDEISDVRLHVVGTACCQMIVGWMDGNPPSGSTCSDPGLEFGILEQDEVVHRTVHTIPGIFDNSLTYATCEEQAVDLEIPFDPAGTDPDWSLLSGGSGTVMVKGLDIPSRLDCSYPYICISDPSLVLTAAELVVELPEATPVEARPWGTLKAIYR